MTLPFAQSTARHAFPLMIPAQAAKHIIHNEALLHLDQLIGTSCLSDSLNSPPDQPNIGDSYIVPEGADEAWGHAADTLCHWTAEGWESHSPVSGLTAYIQDRDALRVFTGQEWRSIGGADEPSFLGINSQADATNRFSVSSPSSLFNHEGSDHRLKINKATTSDTASLVFQSGFSGRAELGLTGNDIFNVKVSADGQDFKEAIHINADGQAHFPYGLNTDMQAARVDRAGGAGRVLGPMSLSTLPMGRETIGLDVNRVYFSAIFVDRPLRLMAAHIARTVGSGDAGSLIRAGLYHLGQPDGDDWMVGERILDYGTCDATQDGHHSFDLGAGLTLERGWYLHAIGTNGSGLSVRSLEWISPGRNHYTLYKSGNTSDFRVAGIARIMTADAQGASIATGFPAIWSGPISDSLSVNPFSQHFLLPEWEDV